MAMKSNISGSAQLISSSKKILVIRISSLGDVLLTTPLLRALKKKFPDKSFSFLVEDNFADALCYNPNLDRVFHYSKKDRGKGIVADLKTQNFDFVIDLQNNLRSKQIVKELKLPSVKFVKPTIEKFLLVQFKINFLKQNKSIPEYYAKSISEDFVLDEFGLDFYLDDGRKAGNNGISKRIGFCPGSQHFTKQYPAEYFIELGKTLTDKGFEIVLLGGKSDREICSRVSSEIPNATDSSNDNDLFALAREMEKCEAVICNDSGLMHLATAVGTPTVAIFGSTVKEFGFAPYKSKSIVIENNSLNCRPCSHIGKAKCPKNHFKCMLDLTPEKVCNEFLKFYDKEK
jgi:ADP-heptose:LPS heptosyltransferase